jgi:hypothetical protein
MTIPTIPKYILLGNSLEQYLLAALIFVVSYILLPIIWNRLVKYLVFAAENLLPSMKDLLDTQLQKFNKKIFLLIAVYLALFSLSIQADVLQTVKGIIFALVGVQMRRMWYV